MSDECVEKVDAENLKILFFTKRERKLAENFTKGFK